MRLRKPVLTDNRQLTTDNRLWRLNGEIHRSSLPLMPARRNEAVPQRGALLFREVRYRKAQLRSRAAWQEQEDEEDRGIRAAASREAEGAAYLRRSRNSVSEQLRKGHHDEGHRRRQHAGAARAAPR